MNIYLIRHGKAEPANPAKKDFERLLTPEGEKIVAESTKIWKNFINHFDEIICSPYLRAKKTAAIIADAFNFEKEVIDDKILEPGSITENLIELANSIDGKNIAFIGHQPDMSYHIASLVSTGEVNLKFSPASVCKISFDGKVTAAKGELRFLLPPFSVK